MICGGDGVDGRNGGSGERVSGGDGRDESREQEG